jgi:hypothetical protein
MNAKVERVKVSENLGARITEIGDAVAKIWRKEFLGLICNFWKWLGVYLELFLKMRGSS